MLETVGQSTILKTGRLILTQTTQLLRILYCLRYPLPSVQQQAFPFKYRISSFQDDKPVQKVLQLSDFHVDLSYTVGSRVDCEDILCCTSTSGTAGAGEDAAGFWGEYVCDLPPRTARHMFEHIAQEHQVSTIYKYIYLKNTNLKIMYLVGHRLHSYDWWFSCPRHVVPIQGE